jgi:hypothetical protein
MASYARSTPTRWPATPVCAAACSHRAPPGAVVMTCWAPRVVVAANASSSDGADHGGAKGDSGTGTSYDDFFNGKDE